jgi:hypothetical protein
MNGMQRLEALRPLLELAQDAAPGLPASKRADIYEGLALAIGTSCPAMRDEAQAICDALREAETRQLTFAALLRPNPNETQKTTRQQ